MNNLVELDNFTGMIFDAKNLFYYNSYFRDYYQDSFRSNQGTEVILDVLKKFNKSGIWLDVGAGPATLFWSLMLAGIQEIHCSEINAEGLKVLSDFMDSDLIPGCYRDVMNMYNIPESHLKSMRKLPHRYFLFDALAPWPGSLGLGKYDMITALGVFGLCKTAEEYKKSFSYLKPFLRSTGVVIGANWVRSDYFIRQGNMDNRYISTQLVQEAANKYGYSVLHLSMEKIEGDPNYDGVVVWALKKEKINTTKC